MIERMSKVTIVCLADDQRESLRVLQGLAAVHVVPVAKPAAAQLDELRRRLGQLESALYRLKARKLPKEYQAQRPAATDGAACLQEVLDALETLRVAEERTRVLNQAMRQLEPWGQFDDAALRRLEEKGWHTALCCCGAKEKVKLPEGAMAFDVVVCDGRRHFLVVSPNDLGDAALPLAHFPQGHDLGALRREAAELRQRTDAAERALDDHAAQDLPLLEAEAKRLREALNFENTCAGMGQGDGNRLVWLVGYVPVSRLDEVRSAAHSHGWAIRYEEVAEEDREVPTKLVIPKPFRMAQVVLDFIGIVPGYREVDVSVSLLIFLALFCGMLVGDAGYGAIFTAATLWFYLKAKKLGDEKTTEGAKLLLTMSLAIVGWGALTGNWFGLKAPGLPWFTQDQNNAHIQLFCFFLGAGHMALAHLWRAKLSHSWRDRLANLGWALFLWGNFFTVKGMLIDGTFGDFTFPKWLYIVGTALIACFGINWRSVSEIINSPFTFINSFGDLLSYIRLFAVGLSSLEIAKAFNAMGASIWAGNRWMLPLGILALAVGHILNVALAVMGVLVHGIRLNTLEFSGHIGLEWSGKPYRPFQK